jgi:hypothetical protein
VAAKGCAGAAGGGSERGAEAAVAGGTANASKRPKRDLAAAAAAAAAAPEDVTPLLVKIHTMGGSVAPLSFSRCARLRRIQGLGIVEGTSSAMPRSESDAQEVTRFSSSHQNACVFTLLRFQGQALKCKHGHRRCEVEHGGAFRRPTFPSDWVVSSHRTFAPRFASKSFLNNFTQSSSWS